MVTITSARTREEHKMTETRKAGMTHEVHESVKAMPRNSDMRKLIAAATQVDTLVQERTMTDDRLTERATELLYAVSGDASVREEVARQLAWVRAFGAAGTLTRTLLSLVLSDMERELRGRDCGNAKLAKLALTARTLISLEETSLPEELLRRHGELSGEVRDMQEPAHTGLQRLPDLYQLPNDAALKSLHDVFAAGGTIPASLTSTKAEWSMEEGTNKHGNPYLKLVRTTGRSTETFVITNPENVIPGKTNVARQRGSALMRKLTPYVFQKANQQSYPDEIMIDLEELVDLGMYGNIDSAWKALSAWQERMSTTDVSVKRGRQGAEGGILFYHRRRKQGVAYISVNPRISLRVFAQQWTIFPSWAYSLSQRAFDLVFHIFYVARQNVGKIAETGSFRISLKALLAPMGLPTPEEAKRGRRYKQLIKDPIKDAVREVEEKVASTPEARGCLTLIPMWNDAAREIDEWLNGTIEVRMVDKYASSFIELHEKSQEKARKRISGRTKRR